MGIVALWRPCPVAAFAAAAFALILVVVPGSAAAALNWTQSQTLSPPGQTADVPKVAMNAAGQGVVAWRETDAQGFTRVRARLREPGGNFGDPSGTFGDPRYVSAPGASASAPSVAIDPSGNAFVAWARADDVEVAFRPSGGSFGAPQNLTPDTEPAYDPDVAMDGQGNTLVGWGRGHSFGGLGPFTQPRVEAVFRPAGQGFGAVATIFNSGSGSEPITTGPTFAFDEQGNATAAWAYSPSSFNQDRFVHYIDAAVRPAGGSFGPNELVSKGASIGNVGAPAAVTMRSGAAMVGWGTSDTSLSRAFTAFRPPGGPWAQPQNVSATGPGVFHSGPAVVAFDPSGNALAGWTRFDSNSGEVDSAFRPAGGSFGSPVPVTPASPQNSSPVLGVDGDGEAVMAWVRRGTDSDQAFSAVRSAGAGGAFDAPQPISPTGEFGNDNTALSVNQSGNAVAAWSRIVGVDKTVEVAFGIPPESPIPPPPPPPPPPAPIPTPEGSIQLAREPKSGEALVLTAEVVGPVDRLEWDFGSGFPKVVGQVVDGQLQRSVRLRPEQRALNVTVRAIGPGGTTQLGRSLNLPRLPSGDLAQEVRRGLSRARPVVAVGQAEVLTGRSGGCGPVTVVSGQQSVAGCLTPIEDLGDIPAGERGVLEPLARELRLDVARADLMRTAVELSDGYLARARVVIPGGWPVVPAGGASLVSFPQAEALVSSNAAVQAGGLSLKPPGSGFNLKLDPSTSTVKLGSVVRPPQLPSIGGFRLVGDFKVDLFGGEARIDASLKLPPWIKRAGVDVQSQIKMRATPDELIIDELRVGPINAQLGGLNVAGFQVVYRRAEDEWQGQGRACVIGSACLDMVPPNGQVRIKNGSLAFAGASLGFPPPGVPLATGLNLERIGFGVGLDPTRFTGNARLVFSQLLVIDGRLVMAFPDAQHPFILRRDEVGNDFPERLYNYRYTGFTMGITAAAALRLPAVGEMPIANAYVLYEYPGYIALGGGMNYAFREPITNVALISVDGRIDGEFYAPTGRFNVDGRMNGCVVEIVCKGLDGNVSSNGMSVCTTVSAFIHEFHVGGAIRWSPFKFIPYLDGCKWGRFREANVRPLRAAQAGGIYSVRRSADDAASQMVMIEGVDAAPRVRVTGPGGQALDSPEGSGLVTTQDAKLRIMRSEQGRFVAVGLAGADEGDYSIDPLPGTPAIKGIQESTAMPRARATGSVSGRGSRRVLTYDVSRQADQRVTFVEVDAGGGANEIGTVEGGGRGKLAFRPMPGRGIRRVEARFESDGVPAEQITIARFRPPSPVLGRPAGLRVRRSGTKLVLSWRRVREATRHEVALTPSSGDQRLVQVRGTRAVLRGVAKSLSGSVSVRGVDGVREGPAASKSFRRTARGASGFRELKRCRTRGRRVVCRGR